MILPAFLSYPIPLREPGLAHAVVRSQIIFLVTTYVMKTIMFFAYVQIVDYRIELMSIGLIMTSTVLAFVIDWDRYARPWTSLVFLMNLLAVLLFSVASDTHTLLLLCLLPLVDTALNTGVIGAATAASLFVVMAVMGGFSAYRRLAVLEDPTETLRLALVCATVTLLAISLIITLEMRQRDVRARLTRSVQHILIGEVTLTETQNFNFKSMLNSLPDAVIRIQQNGIVCCTNQAADRLAGRFNTTIEDLFRRQAHYREDRTSLYATGDSPLARAAKGETVRNEVVWIGELDEPDRISLLVCSYHVREFPGSPASIVIVCRDVTQERDREQVRSQLLHSVTHELKTPLTSIIGYVDLVAESGHATEQDVARLEVVSQNAERMLNLISDLNFADDTGDEYALKLVIHDLSGVVRDSIRALHPVAAAKSITLSCRELPHALVLGDPTRLRQVVDNLVSNAIKYTEEGGHVDVSIRVAGDFVELAVKDDGRGMTHDEVAGLFQPYYRANSVRKTDIMGSGLGLMITQGIIKRHGGMIRVESEWQHGSTFTVDLPRVSA